MKLAVVHGSLGAIDSLEAAIREQGDHQCVWVAADGRGIAAKCRAQPPDMLLLDVELSGPDAAEITRAVLETKTCGVVLVGASLSSGFSAAYEAMGAGALDLIPLPAATRWGPGDASVLCTRLSKLARALTPNARAVPTAVDPDPNFKSGLNRAVGSEKLVVIGASTGGPQAIHQILTSLPRPLTCALAIVQHVEGEFAAGMAEWLGESTGVTVKLAAAGARLEPGTVLVAGSDRHLVLTAARTLSYNDEPREAIHRPSIDVFFKSVARHWSNPGVAVLLTGMGRDGAVGMQELRRAGWRTIAQDESTSVVFGMPKAAIQLGAAERTLPIGDVGPAVGRWISG